MKRNKKFAKIRTFVANNWKFTLPLVLVVASLLLILGYKLGSATGGMSSDEYELQQTIVRGELSFESVIRQPHFLPYYLILFLLQLSPFGGAAAIRTIGVAFGLLSIWGMYYILKKWYTTRVALLGITLYATSSWFIHTSRYADPTVTYLLLPLLVATMIALQEKARSRLAISLATIFGMSAVYIPGAIFFLAPAVFIKRRLLLAALRLQPLWYRVSIAFTVVIMLAPLVTMLIKPLQGQHSALQNIQYLFGLPVDGISSLTSMLTTAKDTFLNIFIYSNAGPLYVPGHLPWFDIATSILVLIGMVQFARYWRLDRSKLIGISALVGFLLVSLGGPVSSVVLLPFLFLLVFEGLKWLLEQWLSVFPKNPIARGFAVAAICALTLSIGTYQLAKYHYAWAKAPETRQVFNKHP